MVKRKVSKRVASKTVKRVKNNGSFFNALAKNQLVIIGLLGVVAIAALVLMFLQLL